MVVPSSIAVTTAPPYAGANRIRCERSTADPAALSALAWAPAGRGQRTPPRPPRHPRPRLTGLRRATQVANATRWGHRTHATSTCRRARAGHLLRPQPAGPGDDPAGASAL